MSAIRIDLADNAFELAMLKGYLSIAATAPKGLKLEQQGAELLVSSDAELSEGDLSELLKWLGASSRGNSPLRVLEPEAWKGRAAIPAESGGAQRWKCSRCSRDVMAGVNDAGTVGGLCHDCWAVDMRLAGQPVQPVVPTPSAPPGARLQPPASSPAAPSSSSTESALLSLSKSQAPAAPALAFIGNASLSLPIVAAAHELPPASDYALAICAHRLAYSDGKIWRVIEGNVPPQS